MAVDKKDESTNSESIIKTLGELTKALAKIESRMTDLEVTSKGGDAGFEKALKVEPTEKVELSAAERTWYGDDAPKGVQVIIRQILGGDFNATMKTNDLLPTSLVTVLVPKRLSGKDRDFRTIGVNNNTVESDTRKWAERVKSQIHREWFSQRKGAPLFKVA
jgi:hypothetical protein